MSGFHRKLAVQRYPQDVIGRDRLNMDFLQRLEDGIRLLDFL
jgi:hypothetical protein